MSTQKHRNVSVKPPIWNHAQASLVGGSAVPRFAGWNCERPRHFPSRDQRECPMGRRPMGHSLRSRLGQAGLNGEKSWSRSSKAPGFAGLNRKRPLPAKRYNRSLRSRLGQAGLNGEKSWSRSKAPGFAGLNGKRRLPAKRYSRSLWSRLGQAGLSGRDHGLGVAMPPAWPEGTVRARTAAHRAGAVKDR